MGFKRGQKVYKLRFEDPEFEGLVVRTRSVSLGEFLTMEELISGDLVKDNVDKLFKAFVDVVVSWNLEDDDDQPVPITVGGLYAQDLEFVKAIIDAWKDAMVGVADPLSQTSTGGEPSLVESIPMEPLSESQAS